MNDPIRKTIDEFIDIFTHNVKQFKCIDLTASNGHRVQKIIEPIHDIKIIAKWDPYLVQNIEYNICHQEYTINYKKKSYDWHEKFNPHNTKFRIYCQYSGQIELIRQHVVFLKLLNS
jgi:hypothetical protein